MFMFLSVFYSNSVIVTVITLLVMTMMVIAVISNGDSDIAIIQYAQK